MSAVYAQCIRGFLYTLSREEISVTLCIRIRVDARIRIYLYTLTSQYQNQSFSARALLTNPLRCPDTNRIRVDGRIRFVYATCGRRYFCIRIKKICGYKNLRICVDGASAWQPLLLTPAKPFHAASFFFSRAVNSL